MTKEQMRRIVEMNANDPYRPSKSWWLSQIKVDSTFPESKDLSKSP
jgi:hypothetical protein